MSGYLMVWLLRWADAPMPPCLSRALLLSLSWHPPPPPSSDTAWIREFRDKGLHVFGQDALRANGRDAVGINPFAIRRLEVGGPQEARRGVTLG